MEKIDYRVNGKSIIIDGLKAFNLKFMVEGGQAFRWTKEGDWYIGVVGNKVIKSKQEGESLIIKTNRGEKDIQFWIDYFDINRDYSILEEKLKKDKTIEKAVIYSSGNRVIKQDPWECTASFILSSNKSFNLIKSSIENICTKFGEPIEFEGKIYYSFPKPEILAKSKIEDLQICKCGYRADYLQKSAALVSSGKIDLDGLKKMDKEKAKEGLQKLNGVGPKVAECILLFSLQKYDAFPVDVWIKRIMEDLYFNGRQTNINRISEMASSKFGMLSGFVQQYLYYFARITSLEKS